MIFWATILSFLIGIMTYMFYPRTDQIKTVHLPASEAYVASFVAQHQAAKDFLREGLVGLNKLPENIANKTADDKILILSGARGKEQGGKTFTKNTDGVSQTISGDDTPLADFLPITQGLVTTANFKPQLNEGFVSVLACFDHPERKVWNTTSEKEEYVTSSLIKCIDDDNSVAPTKYVFTYGPMPDYLDEPFMRRKILLFETAILKRTHGSPDCGFLVKKDGRYFINTSQRLTRTIPNVFMEELTNGGYLGSGNELRGNRHNNRSARVYANVDGNSAGFLFCMTPANDPYPRNGLIANYDSVINNGEIGSHRETLGEWVNLASIDGTWNATITGSGNWHEGNYGSENTQDKGFSFDGNRLVKTNIPMTELGSSFTLSFVALFNEGNYQILGAESCTSGDGVGCLTAEYNEGKIRFNIAENGRNSFVEGMVAPNSITQIDYIFHSTGHKLLIGGEVVDEKVFSEGDTSESLNLSGGNFVLGGVSGNKWQGALYNFLIYKRSLDLGIYSDLFDQTTKEWQEKFDVRGLARIYKTNMQRYDYQYQKEYKGIDNAIRKDSKGKYEEYFKDKYPDRYKEYLKKKDINKYEAYLKANYPEEYETYIKEKENSSGN